MKATFEQSELRDTLGLVASACGTNTTLDILSCAFIRSESGAVEFTGTDLEVGIDVKSRAVGEKDGVVAIKAKKLFALVKELPTTEPITFEGEAGNLIVSFSDGSYKFIGMDAGDYPARTEFEGESFTLHSSELLPILQQTEFAASRDKYRYELNSVYFNQKEVIATNSGIMSSVAMPLQTPQFVLPLQAASELLKTFKDLDVDIDVKVGKQRISFATDTIRLTSRLMGESSLRYWEFIPEKYWRVTPAFDIEERVEHAHSVILDKSEFLQACKRVSVFADKEALITLEISGDEIRLSCEDVSAGSSELTLTCSGSGSDVTFCFKVHALYNTISRIKGDAFQIEYKDALSVVALKSTDTDDFVSIIAPSRKSADDYDDDYDDYDDDYYYEEE